MYCPSCGTENAYGLRYCKRCGENLTNNQASADGGSVKKMRQGEFGWEIEEIEAPGISMKKLAGMFWAVAVFGFVSLMTLFGSLIPLVLLGADRKTIALMLVFGTIIIGSIAWLLVSQLSRVIDLIKLSERAPRRVAMPTEQNYPQMTAPPASVSSVTEHTTRNFDHTAYNEPRASE